MTKRITTMSLCAVIFILLFACGGRNKSLVGFYKLTSVIVEGYGEVSDMIENEGGQCYFTFNADGTCYMDFDGDRLEGTWDKKYIYGVGDEGSSYTYENGQITIIIDEYNSMVLTRLSD